MSAGEHKVNLSHIQPQTRRETSPNPAGGLGASNSHENNRNIARSISQTDGQTESEPTTKTADEIWRQRLKSLKADHAAKFSPVSEEQISGLKELDRHMIIGPAKLTEIDLSAASIQDSFLASLRLIRSNLSAAKLNRSLLEAVEIRHSNLKEIDLSESIFQDSNYFIDCNLIGADFRDISFTDRQSKIIIDESSDLRDAKFSRTSIEKNSSSFVIDGNKPVLVSDPMCTRHSPAEVMDRLKGKGALIVDD
ncbi:MAG: pentapeptide repeat-containing protein [Candidatus Melainabacteria bacterium]|nr:pentapeptide repeat-containing protein [Candidatus Melainabacteria bacterium]